MAAISDRGSGGMCHYVFIRGSTSSFNVAHTHPPSRPHYLSPLLLLPPPPTPPATAVEGEETPVQTANDARVTRSSIL